LLRVTLARVKGKGKPQARRALEEQVARLNALRDDPRSPEARAEIAGALDSSRAMLVTAAANVVAEAELEGVAPALRAAFARFLHDAARSDPGCAAKTAVARALYKLCESAIDVFLPGIHHVQREPVWGGSVDTAIELRGVCALGLVRGGYPDAMLELAELLADREVMARVAAAQAIAYSERADVGLPLLRMKARLGDDDPRVSAACFAALLALAPAGSLPFVGSFLQADAVEVQEAALIALGESRLPEALPALQAFIGGFPEQAVRAVALTAIGLLRSEAGWEHLLSVVREGDYGVACDALAALATYCGDAKLRERTLAAVAGSGDARLAAEARRVLRE
jgi:HEAT repeat protein